MIIMKENENDVKMIMKKWWKMIMKMKMIC